MLQKTISVINAHTGTFVAEVDLKVLGRWLAKNKLQVVRWDTARVLVESAPVR